MMGIAAMHRKLRRPKTYPALSLVEVLVVLALVATTMIAATQVTVSSLVKIKENEVDDYVNGLMVRVLEAAKSPQVLNIDNSLTGLTAFQGSYILNVPISTSVTQGTNPTFKQQSITMDKIAAAQCNSSSPNYVQIPDLGKYTPPPVCLQALVVPLTGIGSATIYQVTVRAAYILSSGPVERELIGYRRADLTQAVLPPPAPPPACTVKSVVKDFPAPTVDAQGYSNYSDSILATTLNTTYPQWQIQLFADGNAVAPSTVSAGGVTYTNTGGSGIPVGSDDSGVRFDYQGKWEKLVSPPLAVVSSGQTSVPVTVNITAKAKYSLPARYTITYCL